MKITQRRQTKKAKKQRRSKKVKGLSGGGEPKITIVYRSELIVNDQTDLTEQWRNGLLKRRPAIRITSDIGTNIWRFLVTLTDPDAPNGQEGTNNRVWTHWVAIINNGIIEYESIPYKHPSPPRGIHRYQFNFYAININVRTPGFINDTERLPGLDNELTRSNYFDKILNEKTKLLSKIGQTITFTVNSNK